MKICLNCGRETKNKKFCSSKCFGISYKNKKVAKICEGCNKKFEKVASDKRIYCSYACRGLNSRKRILKKCKLCNKEFETFPCRTKKGYCSSDCYDKSKIKIITNKIKCAKCNRNKDISLFPKHNSSWCKFCMNIASIKSQTSTKGRYKHAINQARRRKINFSINIEEYIKLISLPCHYCANKISETGSGLDRKNNSEGYSEDNCVPCCPRCNWIKGWYLTYNEMVWLGQQLKVLDKLNLK